MQRDYTTNKHTHTLSLIASEKRECYINEIRIESMERKILRVKQLLENKSTIGIVKKYKGFGRQNLENS